MNVTRFQQSLLAWYSQNARSLPWRATADPYAIWVSEVMLQQTQVRKVVPYYARFLRQFPTLACLARASEAEVLHVWQGLGYYRRARNLHRAAAMVMEQFGGAVPSDLADLRKLPGVGQYMAGAIRSFAFNLDSAIVEANTGRVLARLFAIHGQLNDRVVQRQLWERANEVLNETLPGDHNQALTELGALICLPTAHCDECPVQAHCLAFQDGDVENIPEPKSRPKTVEIFHVAALIRRRGKILLARIPAHQWWGGMWELPRIEVQKDDVPERELCEFVHDELGLGVTDCHFLAQLTHSVTKHRIELRCYGMDALRGRTRSGHYDEHGWFQPEQMAELALSAPQSRLLHKLYPLGEARLNF